MMNNKKGSGGSVATPGRGRGLILFCKNKKSIESGVGRSLDDSNSQTHVNESGSSIRGLSLLRDSSTRNEDSQSERDTGKGTLPTGSESISSAANEIESLPKITKKPKESLGEKQQTSSLNVFSNINCVRLEKIDNFEWHSYTVDFELNNYELNPIDKRMLFLKTTLKETLLSNNVKAWCFQLPNVLYTAGKIPQHLMKIETKIHAHVVELVFQRIRDSEIDMQLFYDALFQKIAVMRSSPKYFIPLRLTPEPQRFEKYPGQVIDVVIENETKITVRCTSAPTNHGTVRDVISDCLVYTAIKGMDKEYFQTLVYKCLKDLVVLTDIENTTMIVCDIIWDKEVPENDQRDRYFHKRGIKREKYPTLVCRKCNNDQTFYMEAENLNIQGSKRVGASHPAARGHTEGGADRISVFLGEPVSGQQRQLAMMRYLKFSQNEVVRDELRFWGLKLVDTAVISNGILLKSDQVLCVGGNDVTATDTEGWRDRLSNQQVHTPVQISNWVVVAQRGDENTVRSMIDNLRNDSPRLGIEMREPTMSQYVLKDDAKSYVDALKGIQAKVPQLQLAVVIMRVSRDDIYREVKRWALTSQNKHIATQVLIRDTARAIANRLETSLSVITQINCKMGGDLWTLDGAVTETLVIGMSGYTGVSGDSWVGVVSSRNRLFSKWYSSAFNDMKHFGQYLSNALLKYKMENKGDLPHTTFVFRRQLSPVSEEEMTTLRTFCGPKCAIVVVSLLDGVELSQYFDSQIEAKGVEGLQELQRKLIYLPVRKGVATDSLAFYLESNTSKVGTETITKVIKQLKHMYFNVAGETPLPAPLLYAGKCAEFNADVLDKSPDETLKDTLYYL